LCPCGLNRGTRDYSWDFLWWSPTLRRREEDGWEVDGGGLLAARQGVGSVWQRQRGIGELALHYGVLGRAIGPAWWLVGLAREEEGRSGLRPATRPMRACRATS